MDPLLFALCLGLCSAFTLALANAFVKASGDVLMSRAVLSLAAAAMVAPLAFFVPMPDAQTWRFLAISIPVHMAYQYALVHALNRGDLSVVFPLMRGSAPIITALGAYLFLDEQLSVLEMTGLLIASLATMIFALPKTLSNHAPNEKQTFFSGALLWALATGLGVAAYNVVDAAAVRVAPTVLTFIVWLFLLDWVGVNSAALLKRKHLYISGLKQRWRYGVAAGGLSIISFGMALFGFRIAPTSYISALRETSVLMAALIGVLAFKEGFGARRIIAAVFLAIGLTLFQLGRG